MDEHTGQRDPTHSETLAALEAAKAEIARLELAAEMSERLVNAGAFQMEWDTMQVTWSANTLRLFGVTEEQFGKDYNSITEFIHPDDRPSFDLTMADVIATRGPYSHRHRIIRHDGEIRHVREVADTAGGPTGTLFFGVTQDITDLVEAKAAEDEMQSMIQLAGEVAKLGGWELDIRTGMVEISPVTAELHDISDLRQKPMAQAFDFYTAESRARIEAAISRSIEARIGFDENLSMVSATGVLRRVRLVVQPVLSEDGGCVIRFRGAMQDITELTEAKEKAQRAEDFSKMAERVAQLGGWRIDAASRIAHITPMTAMLHDLPTDAPLTLDQAFEFYAPPERVRLDGTLQKTFESGQDFDDVFKITTAKGRNVTLRITGQAMRSEDGTQIIGAEGAVQDVTELMSTREENTQLAIKIQETIDGLPDPLLFLDQDLCLTYLNRQAEELLGFTAAEMIGTELFGSLPIFENSQIEEGARAAMVLRKTFQVTERIESLGKTLAISAYPVAERLAILLRDVSDDVTRAEQLKLLEEAVSRLNDIILITKAEPLDGADNPTIVYVNEAFVRRTGYSREEVIGKSPRMLQGPKTQRHELDKIRRALLAWKPVRAELINYTKTGQEFWLELDIVPIADTTGWFTHWVAVERDISDRKHADEQMRLNDERFRLVSAATSDVVWDCDLETKDIWWNDNIAAHFGYSVGNQKTPSRWWYENIHPADRDVVWNSVRAALDGSGSIWKSQYRFHRADGTVATVLDNGYIIRDVDGKAVRILGSMVDITDRLQMDAQLRQAQKLEAVGQLTGGVAHDFNNLLLVILGNTEDLSESLSAQPQLNKMATMAMTAAQRGAELTSRLLAFSRKQSLDPKPVDLNQLVQRLDGMLRRTLPAGVAIELVKGAGLWKAFIDEGQMETALLNLAINARDAMNGNGHLTIETSNSYIDEQYAAQHEEVHSGAYVLISVSDTGCGMSQETLERVFEPFFTTKDVGHGSGLGLSMVYGYLKQSGGHVKIYSEIDVGTTIKLYVPRAAVSTSPRLAQPRLSAQRGNGEHILIAEDDDLVREHLASQLVSLNYRVSIAENGKAALSIIELTNDLDLLLTDVVMPGGMNGRQLADAALQIRPELKVLYTSGYTENFIVHQGRLDAGIELLSKPYRREELASRLRKILATTKRLNME